jgi:hypothetical protein
MVPPSIPTPAQGSHKVGRKRKVDRNSARQANNGGGAVNVGENMTPSMLAHNHNTSSCAKRQIIVQNDVMDGTTGNSSNSSHGHNNNGSLTAPVTPGSVGHDSGSSPHHSEPDNSSDSVRWRKISHQPQTWDNTVIILIN